jgi:hypothetical protein
MAIAVRDGIESSEHRESLETSMEIASISSLDLGKQTAIIPETMHPDGKPTFFGMIARMPGMAKPPLLNVMLAILRNNAMMCGRPDDHADSRELSRKRSE